MAGQTLHALERPSFDKPPHLLIAVSPYYKDIAEALLAGARAEIEAAGGTHETAELPGALELPGAIATAARLGEFDGYVALGCVIRGETYHFEIVAGESARALSVLTLQGLAIGNGILTVDTYEQAEVRAKDQDKGAGAAAAALHLIATARRWGKTEKGLGFTAGRLGGDGA